MKRLIALLLLSLVLISCDKGLDDAKKGTNQQQEQGEETNNNDQKMEE